jgi:hypothetical protein
MISSFHSENLDLKDPTDMNLFKPECVKTLAELVRVTDSFDEH